MVPDRAPERLRTRLLASRVRQSLLVFGLGAILAAAAAWMYFGVERSLRELRAQSLPALLDAKTKSIEVFIAERRAVSERWAEDPHIVALTIDLARRAPGSNPAELCRSPDVAAWRDAFALLLRDEGVVAVNAVDRDGRIFASTLTDVCGLHAQPRTVAPQMARCSAGAPSSSVPMPRIRSWWRHSPSSGSGRSRGSKPRCATRRASPSRRSASQRTSIAISKASCRRQGPAIPVRRMHSTRRAPCSPRCAMRAPCAARACCRKARPTPHSSSRYATRAWRSKRGSRSTARPAEWPLTRPVAAALAASAASAGIATRGVLLDPYRNYRGAEVIGAWRWLPDERIGVVAEIGVAEAYAPLRYVRLTLGAVLALLVVTAAGRPGPRLTLARLSGKPAAGRRIGAYRLERELAEGGTATVHLARHALLKRPTAIKILKRNHATDELSARFEREVRLVSELRHPNTIEIYDYGHTADGLLYYAMEYVDGLTLEALVARERALPLGRMRHIVVQVCAALTEVHGKGMVHRDIKPENVMVCERGGEFDFVKLLDFGIVKRIEAAQGAHPDEARALTRQVRLLGTPAYMPPERIGAPSGVDARADIYGVGAIIFFLVAGRPPFAGDDEAALLRQVLADPVPRLAEVARGVPAPLDDLVARCLAKTPAERPGTVADIVAVLESLQLPPWTREDARNWWALWRKACSRR